uniref:Uncharacterized protein n=1 Tax=Sphaerodactylus townsendi TaxID=933632 RepID=A0ACB8EJI8_9SAUR
MAEGENCKVSPAEQKEDFEVIDSSQIPSTSELRSDGKERTAEDSPWPAPIVSFARKASENLAVSYGNALKSAALVGLIPKPVSNDSTAKLNLLQSKHTSDCRFIVQFREEQAVPQPETAQPTNILSGLLHYDQQADRDAPPTPVVELLYAVPTFLPL